MSVKPAENRCLIYCLNQETEVVAGFGFIFPAMQDVNSASLSMKISLISGILFHNDQNHIIVPLLCDHMNISEKDM
ncbi:hypothetical protein DMI69_06705 [Escherichia coli]|nr:hypothetical protein [Escherichia coli]